MDRGNIDHIISAQQRNSLNRLLRSHIRALCLRQVNWNTAGWSLENQVTAPTSVAVPHAVVMTTFVSDPF